MEARIVHTAKVLTTFRLVGFHNWPGALPPVAYLAQRHRHVFTVKVEAGVGHGDRQIEFHMLKRETQEICRLVFNQNEHGEFEFSDRSCEHIAEMILKNSRGAVRAVEVWEDDENGARVER